MRIKQGITFHNGKDLTANDVIYTFQTVLNPKAPAAAAAGLASIDAKGMTKLDNYTVRIPCSTPFATLHQALAIPGYSDIIPVGYNPTAPVGTGPFRLKSFSPGTQSTFVRYDGYWQTGLPYLDEIVITDYSDQTSQVNALLAGQVNVVNLLIGRRHLRGPGRGQERPGLGRRRLEPVHHAGGHRDVQRRAHPAGHAAGRRPPADARPGLRRLRDARATTCSGSGRPEYDHSLPQRQQDIDQAKSLLKAAGAEGLHVQLVTSDIGQAHGPGRAGARPAGLRRPA